MFLTRASAVATRSNRPPRRTLFPLPRRRSRCRHRRPPAPVLPLPTLPSPPPSVRRGPDRPPPPPLGRPSLDRPPAVAASQPASRQPTLPAGRRPRVLIITIIITGIVYRTTSARPADAGGPPSPFALGSCRAADRGGDDRSCSQRRYTRRHAHPYPTTTVSHSPFFVLISPSA